MAVARRAAYEEAKVAQLTAELKIAATRTAAASEANTFKPGQLAWNTPSTMLMGQSAKVELRVTREQSRFAGLAARVQASGPTTAADADLSRILSARLESTAFDIEPKEARRQQIPNGKDAVWVWVIEPKKAGTHTLALTVESVVELAPIVESMSRQITVSSLPASAAPVGQQTGEFITKNWEKLLTLVLIPLVGGVWAYIKRRRAVASGAPLPPIHPDTR